MTTLPHPADLSVDDPSLRRAASEPSAWAQHLPRLRRLCAVLTGDIAAADDLAQDTVEQAWQIRQRLRDPDSLGPWLDAIARHVCRRWQRRTGRNAARVTHADDEVLAALPSGDPPLDAVLEREDLRDLLSRALGLLPPLTRDMLLARYVDEQGPAEIAATHGMSADAVSMRLRRGREKLRMLLEERFADDPVAEPWLTRHQAGWRTTRLRCRSCGDSTLRMRWDHGIGSLDFCCLRCEPYDVGARYALDNPALAPLLDGLRRPSAMLGRLGRWGYGYWADALRLGTAPCSGCGLSVRVQPYRRQEQLPWAVRHGWVVGCSSCGTELSTSLAGLAQHQPEVRESLVAHSRMHVVAEQHIELEGSAAVTLPFVDPVSGARVDVLFDAGTNRPLRVVPAARRGRRTGS